MNDTLFYIYEWYNIENNEIFYVGKGCGNRAKSTSKRNRNFKIYVENHKCAYRIIKYFTDEKEALKQEEKRILELKANGQCKCNLDNGGKGGLNFVWTDEMRKYKSENNPMKSTSQRARMSINNPMKNKEVVQKVAKKKCRSVIIEDIYFESVKAASIYYKVFDTEVINWCKRGYDRNKKPCRYTDEEQKDFTLKTTNSKKVIIDDKVFNSVREGAQYIGVCSETLIRAIKHNRKCKKYIVKYGNQQPSTDLKGL